MSNGASKIDTSMGIMSPIAQAEMANQQTTGEKPENKLGPEDDNGPASLNEEEDDNEAGQKPVKKATKKPRNQGKRQGGKEPRNQGTKETGRSRNRTAENDEDDTSEPEEAAEDVTASSLEDVLFGGEIDPDEDTVKANIELPRYVKRALKKAAIYEGESEYKLVRDILLGRREPLSDFYVKDLYDRAKAGRLK